MRFYFFDFYGKNGWMRAKTKEAMLPRAVHQTLMRSTGFAAALLGAQLLQVVSTPIHADESVPLQATQPQHETRVDMGWAGAKGSKHFIGRASASRPMLLKVSEPASTSQEVWKALARSTWIADGKTNAPRVVYVFTDPNCPYCSKFWADARPWVESGQVQIRHVLVGILRPSSQGKAAALLASHDPASALHDYEARQTKGISSQMAAGHLHALDDPSLKPLEPIPADIDSRLLANAALMQALSMHATPAFVWRDDSGELRGQMGLPPDHLETVLGPKPGRG
jgi:protein-disulfide isomerase